MPYLTPDVPNRLVPVLVQVPDTMLPSFWGALLDLSEEQNWEQFQQLTVEQAAGYGDAIVLSIQEGIQVTSNLIIQGENGLPEYGGVEKLRLNGGTLTDILGGGVEYTPTGQGSQVVTDYTNSSVLVGGTLPAPEKSMWVIKTGHLVFVIFHFSFQSTSAAFTFTVPYAAADGLFQITPCYIGNNNLGQNGPGRIRLTAGSNVVTVGRTLANDGQFSTTGLKWASGQFSYRTDE